MQDCSSGVVDRMCTACNVNAADCMNLTALDYCIYKGDSERADLMVKNGARMDPVLLLRTKCKRYGAHVQRNQIGTRPQWYLDLQQRFATPLRRYDIIGAAACLLELHAGSPKSLAAQMRHPQR